MDATEFETDKQNAYNADGTPFHVVCFDNGGETLDQTMSI